MHAVIYEHSCWLQGDCEAETLKQFLESALTASEFQVFGLLDHHFEPQGFTALWLLGESHLALHTFPEEGKSYLHLSSCTRSCFDSFLQFLDGDTRYEKLPAEPTAIAAPSCIS